MDNINEKYRNHIKLRRKGPVREERFNYELSDASMFQVGPRPGPWVYQNFGAHSLEKGWVGPGLRGVGLEARGPFRTHLHFMSHSLARPEDDFSGLTPSRGSLSGT